MTRTFKQYTPTVLTLTEEQKALVPKGEKIRFGLNRVKQKNGDIYVMERAYYIVPETNNPRSIASVKIGVIKKGQEEMIRDVPEKKNKKHKAVELFTSKAQSVLADDRVAGKVRFPLDCFWTVCFLCAMTGRTDARSIADYWNKHRNIIFKGFEEPCNQDISPDTVLRLMSLLTVEHSQNMAKFFAESFADEKTSEKGPTVVAIDGQSVRASRLYDGHCGHILNLYDCNAKSFIGQCVIESKQNEVTRTPELLEPYDLDGTIVTADALFSRASMFEAIIKKGADYCVPVKDNTKVVKREIDAAFTAVLNASENSDLPKMKSLTYENELDHGRIETRSIDVLPASMLPKELRDRWIGLEDGCIIQYFTRRIDKKTGETTSQIKRAVTSVRWDTEDVESLLGSVLRRHWAIENNLHWTLDVAFRQDRIQCKNGKYLYARTWLNKVTLNLLKQFQKSSGSTKSIERLMVDMNDPYVAIRCLKSNID